MRALPSSIVLLGLTLLASCGGGGGGGGSGSAQIDVPFTSFAAVRPNSTVAMSGLSQEGSGTQTLVSGNTVVTSFNAGALNTASTSIQLTYDPALTLSGLTVLTPGTSLSFSRSTGDSVLCGGGVCTFANAAGSAGAVAADAFALGWNYQSFGIWEKDLSVTTFQAGAASVGSMTPVSAVPTVGTAVFTGLASGFFIDAAGTPYFTAAAMTANTDFAARSITFSTTNTQTGNLNTGATAANAGLNLSGIFNYTAGTNQFSGALNTANGQLNGTGTGRFYGPAAEEIGGVYNLTGSGTQRMIGGFGGKR